MGTKRRLRLSGKNKQVFLDGLKRYQERGVRILIDGREATEEQWERILEVYRDGSFYMGDYILEDGTSEGVDLVREERVEYLRPASDPGIRRLTEIHFDRVYHG